ncbi:TIGR02444 family protein [Sphingomonas histidinilytica]|uniref:TIGR02444 family protein n=1 Tax=Rhizorhabdus histidinilytica TaxID=439228 RepID=UPI001ADBD7E1|nr:TIGR02444 family protein [Rhizorhabdus histidinilytica]MBO9379175.1 TIGR02444 family protein [Rhizorhabdus histidinilytica]
MAAVSTSSRHRLDTIWAYFLDLYARPGVKEACLDWQDRMGADVILLLWLLWLGVEDGLAVDDASLRRLDERMKGWRMSVVLPIREARRAIGTLAKAGERDASGLYQRLKRVELAAERMALRRLLLQDGVTGQQLPKHLAATANLERYLGALADGPTIEDRTAIAGLVSAAVAR